MLNDSHMNVRRGRPNKSVMLERYCDKWPIIDMLPRLQLKNLCRAWKIPTASGDENSHLIRDLQLALHQERTGITDAVTSSDEDISVQSD